MCYALHCWWRAHFIFVPKRGRFQLIPGITSLLSPSAWCCCPHSFRNFFSGSTIYCCLACRAALWARRVSGQMSWWRVHALPSREGGVTRRTSAPVSSVCTGSPGLAAQLFSLLLFVGLLQKESWKNSLEGLAWKWYSYTTRFLSQKHNEWTIPGSWVRVRMRERDSLPLSLGFLTASKFLLCSKYILSWWNLNSISSHSVLEEKRGRIKRLFFCLMFLKILYLLVLTWWG